MFHSPGERQVPRRLQPDEQQHYRANAQQGGEFRMMRLGNCRRWESRQVVHLVGMRNGAVIFSRMLTRFQESHFSISRSRLWRRCCSIFQSKNDPEIEFRFQYKMILKMSAAGGWGIAPFSAAQRRFWQPKAAGIRENKTAVVIAKWEGKVGNLVLGFHFSGPLRRNCGNVGISPPLGEIPKGLVERGGSLLWAFHAFHSPVISIAPFPGRRSQRKRGGNGDSILQDRSSLLLAATAGPVVVQIRVRMRRVELVHLLGMLLGIAPFVFLACRPYSGATSVFCTQAYTSARVWPANSIASLAFKNSPICEWVRLSAFRIPICIPQRRAYPAPPIFRIILH